MLKVNRFIIILLVICIGCSEEEMPTNCILREVEVSYEGEISEKYAYEHDGAHYTTVYRYVGNFQTGFTDEKEVFLELDYDSQGRIKSVITRYSDNNYHMEEYAYQSTTGTLVNKVVTDGVEEVVSEWEFLYLENPKDSTYLTTNPLGQRIIVTYKDGNLISIGAEDGTGTIAIYDTTWSTFVDYKYDDRPNAATDYVFRQQIGSPAEGCCANNLVEEIVYAGDVTVSRKMALEFINNQYLKSWTLNSTGRRVEFIYDCN